MGESLKRGRRTDLASGIELAALELFAEFGYDNVTVEQIAARVGVHQRTIPRYFRSKEDLLLAFGRRSSRVLCEELATRPTEESPIEATYQAYVRIRETDAQSMSLLWAKATSTCPSALMTVSAEHMRSLSDALRERLERTMPVDVANALSTAIAGALHGMWRQWVDDGGVDDFAEVVREGLNRLQSVVFTRSDELVQENARLRLENDALRVERDLFRTAAAKLLEDSAAPAQGSPRVAPRRRSDRSRTNVSP